MARICVAFAPEFRRFCARKSTVKWTHRGPPKFAGKSEYLRKLATPADAPQGTDLRHLCALGPAVLLPKISGFAVEISGFAAEGDGQVASLAKNHVTAKAYA
jgi:hypothetical protein